jgi:CubicO group peptidase (beta-lactamase class C family)
VEGYLEGPDQPIGPFFPEILDGTAAGDSARRAITLGDLLTMRAGLESTSFGNYGAWVSADSWVEDALDRPMVDTPGGQMIYSTGTSHLVAVILEKATDQPLRAFAQKHLFDPLGEQIGAWQKDPEGYHFGGNNLAITPRALLKFGQLYLRGGAVVEDGQRVQVIPPDWIGASWNLRVLSSFRNFRYGYFWWMEEFGSERTYFAWGYGGQMLFVVPSLDLVTVMTSSLSGSSRGHSGRLFRFCRTINERL